MAFEAHLWLEGRFSWMVQHNRVHNQAKQVPNFCMTTLLSDNSVGNNHNGQHGFVKMLLVVSNQLSKVISTYCYK